MSRRFLSLPLAALVCLGVAWACTSCREPATAAADRPDSSIDPTLGRHLSAPPVTRERARRTLRPSWPAGWRVIESGVFGDGATSANWFRVEASGTSPTEAAKAAVTALGFDENLEVDSIVEDRQRAVAQWRQGDSFGVIDARQENGLIMVRITVRAPAASAP